MTNRENYLSIARRKGFDHIPVSFNMCPDLKARYDAYVSAHGEPCLMEEGSVPDLPVDRAPDEWFIENCYRDVDMKPNTPIDGWGIAHEKGSPAAFHMTKMHHPMEKFDSVEQIMSYPLPVFHEEGLAKQKEQVEALHARDMIAMGNMQCTIWETSWYMRGMENLMCDMMSEDPMATALLDRVTDLAVKRAVSFARAGADALFLGDDIGTQRAIMMSETLYDEWLKPRLKRVIDAARAVRKDILVFYHSCGHVTELIPHLIEAGVDVLDPVQPECMSFPEIHERYGDRLSFHGTIGTQSVMPFGTPEDVRRAVFENLSVAGKRGGLFACPTHMLEPEVPLENLLAYIRACREYR